MMRSPTPSMRATLVTFSAVRILVVDDSVFMRGILRSMLSGLGVRDIAEAVDGADGLEKARSIRPNIVLLDWEMPVLDGIEFLRILRNPTSFDPFLAVIMTTANRRREQVIAARDAGATEYLCKPVSAKELYEKITNIVVRPRPFIRTASYFGPDRRRFEHPSYPGAERRKA